MDGRKAMEPRAADAAVLGAALAAGFAVCLGTAAVRLGRADAAALPPDPEALAHRVDLGSAAAAEWSLLPGVGPRLASRIAAARESGGPFESLEDLERRVPGVGPEGVRRWKDRVRGPEPRAGEEGR